MQSTTLTELSLIEQERRKADALNQEPGNLTGYDCPKCLNRGFVWRVRESGDRYAEECECILTRRNVRYLKESGLSGMVNGGYTFERWKSLEDWQKRVFDMAKRYAEKPEGWFYLAGRPGTGKTHLCTAICGELMNRGYQTRYMLWRDFAVKAKAAVNDGEYEEMVQPMKSARVLYIDDLFKTGKGAEPTSGDFNLAFEIINSRYYDEKKITIFSSELTARQIIAMDEGVGSRIYEKSKTNYADLSGKKNYRLTGN